jgi:hypothetical protein
LRVVLSSQIKQQRGNIMKCTLETKAAQNAVIFNYYNRENGISNEATRAFSINEYLRISFYEQRIEALNNSQVEFKFEIRYADMSEDNAIVLKTKCYEKDCEVIINFFEEDNDFAKHEVQIGVYDEMGYCTYEEIDLALLFDALKLIEVIDALLERHENTNYIGLNQ